MRSRLLRTMALLIAAMAGAWSAWLALIPAYAVAGPLGLDERRFGFLLTALGAGGVVGALLVGRINRLLGRRWSMFADIVGSFALVAVPAIVPAGPGAAVPVGVAAFVAGVGGTMWTVNSRVIVQSAVPDGMLGRFNAASRLVGWGMTPVAAALAGVLAQVAGFRVAFGVFAVLCALLVVPYLRVVTTEAITAALDQPGSRVHKRRSGQDETLPYEGAGRRRDPAHHRAGRRIHLHGAAVLPEIEPVTDGRRAADHGVGRPAPPAGGHHLVPGGDQQLAVRGE
jgi:MFS family permease